MNKIIRIICIRIAVALALVITVNANAQGNSEKRLPPCPPPTILGNMEVCAGGVDTLTVVGPPGSTYVWAPGGAITSSITVSIVGTTTYTVTETNGCGSSMATITLNVVPAPVATLNANNSTTCSGDTVTLIAGGGGRYIWSTGATTQVIKEVPLINTTYTVYVYADSTTCMDSSEVSITVNQSITSSIFVVADTICLGNSATLFVFSSSGNPAYVWSNGATTSSITVTPDSTTTYFVTASGLCADDSIAEVITVLNPTITITSVDTVCAGSTVTLTGGGASTYLWDNGSTTNPTNFVVNQDSTISVAGTTGGCTVRDHKTIYVYSLTNQFISDTVCPGAASLSISVTGGEAPYTYVWNNGITWDSAGPFVVTPPPINYICLVKDGCGNVGIYDVNLVARPGIITIFAPIPDTIAAGGFIDFLNFSKGAVSYSWNFGNGSTASDSAPYQQFNEAGIFPVCLVATSSSGCKDTLCENVDVINEPIVVPNVFTPNGDGINDVLHVQAGGFQTYNFIIFDRWGQQVFAADSPNIDWTGRSSSGVDEVSGIYYYVLNAMDYKGNTTKLKGYIQLLR